MRSFTAHSYFRVLTILEGTSLLTLLLVAMPYRAFTKDPSWVKFMGSVHGVLFLMFIYTCFSIAFDEKWGVRKLALALVTSSIPFGSFWFDHKYLRRG